MTRTDGVGANSNLDAAVDLNFMPVKNMLIGTEIRYTKAEALAGALSGVIRFQRNFP